MCFATVVVAMAVAGVALCDAYVMRHTTMHGQRYGGMLRRCYVHCRLREECEFTVGEARRHQARSTARMMIAVERRKHTRRQRRDSVASRRIAFDGKAEASVRRLRCRFAREEDERNAPLRHYTRSARYCTLTAAAV